MHELCEIEKKRGNFDCKKDSIECLCSLDGKTLASVRQGYFPPNVKVETGIMCAAPEGPGFEAIFETLTLTLG